MTDRHSVLEAIRGHHGYWRVVVRPSVYNESLIGDIRALEEAVDSSRVMFRGWDYPHAPNDGVRRYSDYIEGTVSWDTHHELWRMYKSGQFVHLFGMREDWWTEGELVSGRKAPEPGTVLSLRSTIFSFTEFCMFAGRLAEHLALGPKVVLDYRIFGLGGRRLQVFDPRRVPLNEFRRAAADLDSHGKVMELEPEEIIGNAPRIALDLVEEFFALFQWEPSRDSLEEDQRSLLERRA